MNDYEPTKATRFVETFVDEHLSNWYVRLSRRRFWKGEMNEDKKAAYETLFECLVAVSQLSASLAPFFSDWLYQNLIHPVRKTDQPNSTWNHESVHLTDLLISNTTLIDNDLEQRMDYAQRICSLALSIRKKEKIRVRQPLQKILLPILDASFIAQIDDVKDLILSEINVKELEYVLDSSGLLKKKAKPNFKTLGAKMGKDMKIAADFIQNLSHDAINDIEKNGSFQIKVESITYELTADDMLILTEDIEGWKVANDEDITVALDVNLNPSLIAEGTARDLVNRIQNIRKDKDFNVTDRINITIEEHDAIKLSIEKFAAYIQEETLANTLTIGKSNEAEAVELNDEVTLMIAVGVA
jgi:isoleucyl-tRNA synthetase